MNADNGYLPAFDSMPPLPPHPSARSRNRPNESVSGIHPTPLNPPMPNPIIPAPGNDDGRSKIFAAQPIQVPPPIPSFAARPLRPHMAGGRAWRIGMFHHPHERKRQVRGRGARAARQHRPTCPKPDRAVRDVHGTWPRIAQKSARQLERRALRRERPYGSGRDHAIAENSARTAQGNTSGRFRRTSLVAASVHPQSRPRRFSRSVSTCV